MKRVDTDSLVPTKPHFAALISKTRNIYHEPYDRHDTGHTEVYKYIEYLAFDSEEEMKNWVLLQARTKSSEQFKIINVNPINFEIKMEVKY